MTIFGYEHKTVEEDHNDYHLKITEFLWSNYKLLKWVNIYKFLFKLIGDDRLKKEDMSRGIPTSN